MQLNCNYDGGSIDIIQEDKKRNILILSPKQENGKYSNYYNFTITNNNDLDGTICIKNLKKMIYSGKQEDNLIPLFKSKNGDYKQLSKTKTSMSSGDLFIKINRKEVIEISSYPRYTTKDLESFLEKIKNKHVVIQDAVLKKVTIGSLSNKAIVVIARQHPGETLSSFFIEGMINCIASKLKPSDNTCFVFFPIVNIDGVRNGNHRYTNGYDYNRMWHTTGIIKEIDYIKQELSKINIDFFIDVHCDEITTTDYIRNKNPKIRKNIKAIQVISEPSKLRRFLRALIKQRKIIKFSNKSAREFMESKYGCDTMLVELSLSNPDREKREKQGYNFANNIIEMERKKCKK